MDTTYVVSGGRKNIKKQPKCLPEIFVENEDNNLRYRHEVKHSTPYHNQTPETKKSQLNVSAANDSGYGDYLSSTSSFSYENVSPASNQDKTLWESFSSPVLDLKKKIQGRQTFIDEQPRFKFDAQNLVKATLVIVVISSICFSLFVGVTLNENTLNGKLRSVQYGAEKKIEASKSEGKIIDYDITDDGGNILGGKRASIQFAHNLNKEPEVEEAVAENRIKREAESETTDEETVNEQFVDIEKEISKLRNRKKNLIKKLQMNNQAELLRASAEAKLKSEALNEISKTKSQTKIQTKTKPTNKKQPKSKVSNPLTGSMNKPDKSYLPKKAGRSKQVKDESLDYPDDPFR